MPDKKRPINRFLSLSFFTYSWVFLLSVRSGAQTPSFPPFCWTKFPKKDAKFGTEFPKMFRNLPRNFGRPHSTYQKVVQGKCPLHFLHFNGVVCSNTLFSNTSALTNSLLFMANSTCKILEHLFWSNTSGFQYWGPLARTNLLSALFGPPKIRPKFLALSWQVGKSYPQISLDISHRRFQISNKIHKKKKRAKRTSTGMATLTKSFNCKQKTSKQKLEL